MTWADMGFKCTIWLCYDGNKLISECYLWVAERGALPGLFVPEPLLHVNDRRHKNRQSSWSELDFDMDIGALCVCSMHILYSVRIKGHIPNVDVCVCLCLIYLNVFVPSVIPL